MGSPVIFSFLISSLASEIEGVVMSLDLDSRVWTLHFDGEVSCAVAHGSIGGPIFLSVGGTSLNGLHPFFTFHSPLACFTGQAIF